MDWLTDILRRPAIEWWDLLDIALVAALVYELLKFIKGTRAVQMALSGGFLIGLFFLSRWLQLETVNWNFPVTVAEYTSAATKPPEKVSLSPEFGIT